ncbi:MAG TPA: TadE family protein [Sphingobium sp.]|uniref:TadE/TadG family type IV pilus assembly protein n=1 Tax=Sphingobium sp. TaxID=1912891 RepID=UPI002ED24227
MSAVEFALVAPILLAFILLLIEGGRMIWTQQALQEVANNTARCGALATASCADTASVQSYARARGLQWGVSLTGATVSVAGNQTCNGFAGMNQVSISLPFSVAGGLLGASATTLTASACFPTIS